MTKVPRYAKENYIVEKIFTPEAHSSNADCCMRVFYTCLANIFDVLDHVGVSSALFCASSALWKECTVTSTNVYAESTTGSHVQSREL